MSFDARLKTACEHRVAEEVHFLDPFDRKTVRFLVRPGKQSDIELRLHKKFILRTHPEFGYDFFKDELRLDDSIKLVFRNPLRDVSPLIELSFTTRPENCRRCHGIRVEDDPKYDPLGRIKLVTDSEKLSQDGLKWVLTLLGSNPFHSFIGTRIIDLVGRKIVDFQSLRLALLREITITLRKLQRLQDRQQTYQRTDLRELIDQVDSVTVEGRSEEPTIFDVSYVITSRSGEALTERVPLRVPGLTQLLFPPNRFKRQLPIFRDTTK